MCTVLLPKGVNPIAVNKYIVSYRIITYRIVYHISSYLILYLILPYHIISYIISYAFVTCKGLYLLNPFVYGTILTSSSVSQSKDRIPVQTRYSSPVQTGPGAQPAWYTSVTASFPGVNLPDPSVDHAPPSNAEVKEGVEIYLYSPL